MFTSTNWDGHPALTQIYTYEIRLLVSTPTRSINNLVK